MSDERDLWSVDDVMDDVRCRSGDDRGWRRWGRSDRKKSRRRGLEKLDVSGE
jgi:hypothetical protein